jgi:hypothetical protein
VCGTVSVAAVVIDAAAALDRAVGIFVAELSVLLLVAEMRGWASLLVAFLTL